MTVRIIQGDCRDVLKELPDASVDLCLTDPPYEETSLSWDKTVCGWLESVERVLKPHGSLWCFGSLRFFMSPAARSEFDGWSMVQDIVWEKHNGTNPTGDIFRRVHEIVAHFRPTGRPWADIYRDPQTTPDAVAKQVRRKRRPQQWGDIGEHVYTSEDGGPRRVRSVIYCRSCHGQAVHPTQKPVPLLELLIRYSCPPGGVVLDTFAGSGSTGVAAHQNVREAILVELRPDTCEIARRHVREYAPLFAEVT